MGHRTFKRKNKFERHPSSSQFFQHLGIAHEAAAQGCIAGDMGHLVGAGGGMDGDGDDTDLEHGCIGDSPFGATTVGQHPDVITVPEAALEQTCADALALGKQCIGTPSAPLPTVPPSERHLLGEAVALVFQNFKQPSEVHERSEDELGKCTAPPRTRQQ